MEDLLKNMKAQLYDRVSSPLFFSFLLSWCGWNYRYILIVTSSMSPTDKFLAIDMLDVKFSDTWIYWGCFGFALPLLTSLLYLFAYPWPAKFVYRYVREEQKKLKEIQTKIDDETPLTVEEARELRKQVRAIVKDHESEIKEKDDTIAKLKAENERLQNGASASKAASDGEAKQIEKIQLPTEQASLLAKIAEQPNGIKRLSLLPADVKDRVLVEYTIDQLVEGGFVREHQDLGGPVSYRVTPNGRAYLIESVVGGAIKNFS